VRARPIVDGLEAELSGRLKVIRLDVQGPSAGELGRKYNFRFTPTFVLLDGAGNVLLNRVGALEPQEVRDLIQK
jgi:thioredoxin-related protein